MIPKLLLWFKKNAPLFGLVTICFFGSLAAALILFQHEKKSESAKTKEIIEKYNRVAKSYLELKKKYQDLESDRNNILAQTKNLLSEKAGYEEIKMSAEEMEKANKILSEQKDKLHQESGKLRTERDALAENYSKIKSNYQSLSKQQKVSEEQLITLKIDLKKQVEASPQYQKLDAEVKASKAEIKKLYDAVKILTDKLNSAITTNKKITEREKKLSKQIETTRHSLKLLSDEKNKLSATNKSLNKTVEIAPQKFHDMAEQNKKLLKETSEMHYNLGVFYTEQKNYSQAAKEFERALDFNPSNAKVHYNLGYLFSEELDRHDEAMSHFKRFLEIDPHAKESDEIRNYMMVRQAYGNKIANTK